MNLGPLHRHGAYRVRRGFHGHGDQSLQMKLPGKLDALKNNGENMHKTTRLFLAAIVCAMLAPTPALPAQGDAATAPAGGLTFEAFDALDPDKANALPKATLEELGRMLLAKGDRLRDGKNGKPDLGGAQELYFQAAATGNPVAYDRIGDGFLNEEIAENYMLQTMDDRKRGPGHACQCPQCGAFGCDLPDGQFLG